MVDCKALLSGVEAAPAASAALFRRLLEASPDAVVVVDDGGRILFVNLHAQTLFGYPESELLDQSVDVLVPARLRATHAIHRVRFAGCPRLRAMGSGLTLLGQKRDGSEFPVEISLSPLTIGDHALFSANIRDVTERRHNEYELRRVQAQLLNAVESIQGAFGLFDAQDRLVLCNSAYRHLLSAHLSGDIVGRTFRDIVSAAVTGGRFGFDAASGAELVARWSAHHASPTEVVDVTTPTGQHLRIIERRTTDGGVVATIRDTTQEVTHEEALRQARSLAEEASAAKTEFLTSMSHELRTPLNAILGFAQLLQRDKKDPLSPRQRERVEHVRRGGEHLLRLIDDVLDLARIEAGRVLISLEPVNIAEVLSEVKNTLDPTATRAEISLGVAPIDPEAHEVVADRTRFKQVLINYGSNAIKYGHPGGFVTFRVELRQDAMRISVVDDGQGIALDKQQVIFQPFQRAGQETGPIEGTGIGLTITKRLAELMNGVVGFDSSEGRGSHFWIELPIPRQPSPVAAPLPAPRDDSEWGRTASPGSRFVIVYVEDNPSNIAFMEDLLADFERVELLTAPTAEIGIELVRARRPNVVIMDINLPGISGFEATQKLGAWPETRDIPIIALSAAAMIRDAARVAGAGFYRYLTKPVRVDELMAVLEELLPHGDDARP